MAVNEYGERILIFNPKDLVCLDCGRRQVPCLMHSGYRCIYCEICVEGEHRYVQGS